MLKIPSPPTPFRRAITRLGLLGLVLLTAPMLRAREWHVAGDGNDANDGTTAATAFRSLQKAAGLVEPGDNVLVGNGIYTNADVFENSAVLRLDRSGKPDAWITWKAAPGARPELRPIGWNGIFINASYQIIDGLVVTGGNDSIVLLQALEDAKIKEKNGKKYPGDPRFNTNGIFVTGRLREAGDKPHHNIIRHCTVSKCPGAGVVAIEADYTTIEDNVIFENAWFMRYGGSGISTLNNWAFDDNPGYHNVIQRNKVWNNKTLVPWEVVGRLSDGNGIILDVSDQEGSAANPDDTSDAAKKPAGATNPNGDAPVAAATPVSPQKAPRPVWKGRSLVANNLSAFNGGSGIHTFRTKYVDIINNTTFWNGSNVGYPEIFANRSEDVAILNNIMVPRPAGKVTSNNRNTKLHWDYNLYPIPQNAVSGAHDVVADPRFVKVAADLRDADFRLAEGSPGRDSGTDEVPQSTDLTGAPRPAGTARDRGAFEQ